MQKDFDFTLGLGLPPSVKELRLFKSLIAYVNALGRFCLSEKQFGDGELLSSSVEVYYSLFHLGVATLMMLKQYDFAIQKELLLPDGSNIGRVKRITGLTHKKLRNELEKCSRVSSFVKDLSSILEETVQLRELFSYGPYVQKYDRRTENGQMVIMLYLPVNFDYECGIGASAKIRKSSLRERMERSLLETRHLIGGFATFMRDRVEDYSKTEKDEILSLFLLLPANLHIHLRSYVPEHLFLRIESLCEAFCKELGNGYLNAYHRGEEVFDKQQFDESFKKGQIIQAIELRISKTANGTSKPDNNSNRGC
jgi:hypothetical protein